MFDVYLGLTLVYSVYLLITTNNNVKLRWINIVNVFHIESLKAQTTKFIMHVSVTHKRVAHITLMSTNEDLREH
jgi:hypothetical protein